jgi:hypothetical protein
VIGFYRFRVCFDSIDPAPKLVGVEVIIHSNTGNRRARNLALSHQLAFKFLGVLTAFSVRAGCVGCAGFESPAPLN